jgi:prepilin-type N-terminal cleavage/methylation domain-containing protein/prepilin-type processing-associated H-X9-DG protein
MSESGQKVCPQCGARFECRASAACWCAELPRLNAVEPQSDCLCPKCLEQACRKENLPRKNRIAPKKGFTLIELLVVIATMAILAALLLPVLGQSKQSAQSAKCISNLRQFCLSAQMYWEDNRGLTFPYGGLATNNGEIYWFGWIGNGPEETRPFDPAQGALYPYLGTGVDLCPSFDYTSSQFKLKASVPTCDYGYNLYLSPIGGSPANMQNQGRLSALVLLADSAQVNTFEPPASAQHPMFEEWYYVNNDPTEANGQFRHDQRANAVFCDGHVAREAMVPGTLDQRLPSQQIGWLSAGILTPQNGLAY